MKTFQDWLKVADQSEKQRMSFIKGLINDHKASKIYKQAKDAENYYAGQNTTIKRYERVLYTATGEAVRDLFSANHQIATRFFYREVMQTTSTLLGNGIKWTTGAGEEALGADFDRKIMKAGKQAQIGGVSFGFYNNGQVEVYKITEFVPLYDEEDGALKAGVRFWQIDDQKPLRATLFELDGLTEYQFDEDHPEGFIRKQKRAYIIVKQTSEAFGDEDFQFENYPTFPVVPCWANEIKQSELTPIRATIDCYDLINSGYANNIDDANIIYWTITNAGGMSDFDLCEFLDKMRKLHAAQTDGDQIVTPNTVDVPFAGREALLDRLEKQLYKDAMALNTYDIANGAVTATQIEAAYEPLNEKLDDFESEISDFISRLLVVAGAEDEPSYERSKLVNRTEEITTLTNAGVYLDDEYIREKIMTAMGDKDKIQDSLDKKAAQDIQRMTGGSSAATEAPEAES